MHLAIGILTAYIGKQKTGKGQKVAVSMQDSVLNLCRVKMRDQLRLDKVGYLEEYPQYPHEMEAFKDGVVPRGANAGGGGQPGWILKCKGWETDPNAYIYFTVQGHAWDPICDALGKPEWKTTRPTTRRAGTPAAHHGHLRHHRELHQGQDQVRGRRHLPQVRHPLRAGAVDEGTAARQVAARQRFDRRSAAQGAWQLLHGGQPDQVLGHQAGLVWATHRDVAAAG